jgi:hypothetical protein
MGIPANRQLRSPIEIDEGWLMLTHGVVRCEDIRSALCCLIKGILQKYSPGLASRWFRPRHPTVKGMYPTWSTPAA